MSAPTKPARSLQRRAADCLPELKETIAGRRRALAAKPDQALEARTVALEEAAELLEQITGLIYYE